MTDHEAYSKAVKVAIRALSIENPPDWYRRLDNAWKAYQSSKDQS